MLAGNTFIYHIVPQKEFSVLENRSLETRPEFRLSDLLNGDYQEHYETYLNDQMFQRDRWVSLAVTLERLAGKKEINGVYIGKDGYLLEKYDDSDLEDVQIEENIRILSSFLNDAAARYGKKRTTFLMIPDKAAALPDKLPAYANAGIEKDNSVLTALTGCRSDTSRSPGRIYLLSNRSPLDHLWSLVCLLRMGQAYRPSCQSSGGFQQRNHF